MPDVRSLRRTAQTPLPTMLLRSGRRALTLTTMGALLLPVGLTGAAQAAAPKHLPAGAIKLPKSSVKRVSGVVCGKVRGRWIPGTVVSSRYFLSDTQQAQNYRALARHARGRAKKKDLAQAKFFTQRAARRQSLCTPTGGQLGGSPAPNIGWTPPAPPAPPAPTPLRFDLNGAIGLAVTGNGTSASAAAVTPASMSATPQATAASTSASPSAVTPVSTGAAPQVATAGATDLQKVYANGQLAPAVTSGSASISHVLVGPGGRVYVVFSTPVNLDNTSPFAFGGTRCVLAQVDPSSGVPTCVDSSMSMINWNIGSYSGGSAPIQFDSSGAIYYSGGTNTGQMVLRKFDGSSIRNLVTDNVSLRSFAVAPNGTVVVSGNTMSTNAAWTRAISPTGTVTPLLPNSAAGFTSAANFTSVFPDGNVYMGTYSNSGPAVVRYLTAAPGQIDMTPWIANSTSASNNAQPVWCPNNDYCSGSWANIKWQYSSPDGHEYVVTGTTNDGQLAEYDQPVRLLNSEVKTINVAAGVGNQIALAGTTADGTTNVLTLVNPAGNGSEQELIGANNQIEIYHLNYGAHRNEILFDGLRFSDNQYVVGEYNLSTGQLTVSATLSSKLTDLQSF